MLLVPSQLPPHTEPSDVQTGREPCGAPEVSVEQVPSLPTTSHASHWPVQAVSQQRPSTQELDAQSPLARHAVPSACAKVAAIVRGAVTFVATYVLPDTSAVWSTPSSVSCRSAYPASGVMVHVEEDP